MKRILCTVSNDLTYDQRMIRICISLVEAGYQVKLVGRELPTSNPLMPQTFAQKRLKLYFNKGKLFYLELNIRLFFLLLFSKFDIVYSVDLDTLLSGQTVAFLRNKPAVFDAHEYFTEVPELTERPLSKKIWEITARLSVPNAKHAITVCESLAIVFQERYGVKFSVIRNVPFSQKKIYQPERNESPFVLIYQGVLNDGRGLEQAIMALAYLEGVELWICGEGDLSQALRILVEKNRLEPKVKFFGRVAPAELSKLTHQAHLGLNLLENKGLNYYYSLANKAFDYIQAGIPSLSMDFPEYRRLNETHDVFLLLNNLDPTTISEAINHLRSNKLRYEALSENCRKAAKTLNWEAESKKLELFFRQLD